MNINRLLSRREKDGRPHRREKSRDKSIDKKTSPLSGEGAAPLVNSEPQETPNNVQDVKIQTIRQRLQDRGYLDIEDEQINYALTSKHADGDIDRALEMVILFQESVEGVIKPYNPSIHMRGAENRQGVTCYLDALLFAMFARLGSFEPILYTKFDDEPRRRLSTLIRLWVNMLRTGKLIQTDITTYLQEALAACGWEDAGKLQQQDTSEAFSFITEKLELPLLTLKMDIYHTGTEDDTDDHKFIHERLLEVAVPPNPGDGKPIQLEDCLENFFNNRVEVVRRLERTNTLSSIRSGYSPSTEKGGSSSHVEVAELSWPASDAPTSPQEPGTPLTPFTPTIDRTRSSSIIRRRVVADEENGNPAPDSDALSTSNSIRKGSIRKEVLMPAWQFFNLIPWYTKSSPVNDAEVAAHFSKTRPVLGICLKRYAMSSDGRATRENTFIDIPLDIRLPHFIEDDMKDDEASLMGNFKLSLQSVICHRGNSLHSGHYVSFVRGAAEVADGDSNSSRRLSNSSHPPHYPVDRWFKHDDLAQPERVEYVDIEQALKDEMPYLLFYQVQPTNMYGTSLSLDADNYPPSYDSGIDIRVSGSTLLSDGNPASGNSGITTGQSTPAYRLSSEIEAPRRSINLPEDRPWSHTSADSTTTSAAASIPVPEITSTPATPLTEETTAQRLSRAASKFARSGSRSRPVSSSGEKRISATLSRLTARSKEQLNKSEPKLELFKELSSNNAAIPGTDGTADNRDVGVTTTEYAVPKPGHTTPDRTRGKLGRKRDKSKEPGHVSTSHFDKGKMKEAPDRECIVM